MSEEVKLHEHSPALPIIVKFIASLYPTAWDAYLSLNKLEEGVVAVVGWNGNGTVVANYEDPYPDGGLRITFREKDEVICFLGIEDTLLIDRGPLLDLLYELGDKE